MHKLTNLSRHGARLDAVDPQWHLTSPTPYDPPLTYGGWKQSQALGARIASILNGREASSEETRPSANNLDHENHALCHDRRARKRKHKIVIHTSPFLRCIQTSIAVSAGIEHWKGRLGAEAEQAHPRNHVLHSGSPHTRVMNHRTPPYLSAIPEPGDDCSTKRCTASSSSPHATNKDQAAHMVLRLDAFLGEWLSPDYFDKITPPPSSKMMVAAAKADLLRRGDPIESVQNSSESLNQGYFPGGWKSSHAPPDEPQKSANTALSTMSELGPAPPKLGRANSHSVISPGKRGIRQLVSSVEDGRHLENKNYIPPKPSYAVSPAQSIPQGYVAHARDACTKVDYQWDSMRPPLDWGNGGEYGEEWSAMHRRFRKGLHNMIQWYENHEPAQEPNANRDGMEELQHARTLPSEGTEDEDTDTVLILVTHGAGCNALLGALTNQPVLIDVGMASITLAVRKSIEYRRVSQQDSSPSGYTYRRKSFIDSGVSEYYDIRLTASTDHLRPGSIFLGTTPPRAKSPSLPVREKSPYRYERHVSAPTHQKSSSFSHEAHDRSPVRNSNDSPKEKLHENIERAATTTKSNGGLWTKPVVVIPKPAPPADAKRISISKFHEPTESEQARPKSAHIDESPVSMAINRSNGTSIAQHGLWGTEPTAVKPSNDKTTPKRRWTSTQA